MADGAECDVSSNSEVFDDVDQDPHSILQNVEKTCIKIMVPSMAESSTSKLSSSRHDGSVDHDVKFVKFGDDDSTEHDGAEDDLKTFAGGARAVKWTLETMAAAMDSVLAGELTTTNASRQFCIPRTTLLDRLAMKVRRQHFEQPGTYPLSPENTLKVIDFYHQHEDLNKPTLLRGILKLAEELAAEQGTHFETPLHTRKWLKLFVQKYPDLHILQYNRTRSRSTSSFGSRSSVTMAPRSSSPKLHRSESPHVIHLQVASDPSLYSQQVSQAQSISAHSSHNSSSELITQHSSQVGTHGLHHQSQAAATIHEEANNVGQAFDSFECALAKQGLDAIERKLSPEQRSYFSYRFHNVNLDRGFELWKLCKSKAESSASVDTFEKILASQATAGIEANLASELLKYFRYRHENLGLEEGYKLWSVLKTKTLK